MTTLTIPKKITFENINIPSHKRIGVMGGAFDPIHYGHLLLASEAFFALSLDNVLFIPTGIPPHKRIVNGASSKHRMEMTRLATRDVPEFSVSSIEIDRGGENYMLETLQDLQRSYEENTDFFLLLGMDNIIDFPNWKNPDEVIRLCKLVVMRRYSKGNELMPSNKFLDAAIILNTPIVEISSSDIRNRIRENRTFRFHVPDSVREYIIKKNLYI